LNETARRLDIIEEYYFSSKLREVRQLALEGKPIINMGWKPRLSVDAVKLALEDENAHQYRVIRDCQNCEKYG
jgi:hypothetical protein